MRDPGKHTLTEVLRANGALNEVIAAYYAGCALLALQQVHQSGHIYGSLDPEHLLVDAEAGVTLASTVLPVENPYYMAPEIVLGKRATPASDLWALGVLIFELLVGSPPFKARSTDPDNTFNRIVAGRVHLPPHVSNEAAALIRSLLVVDPEKRVGSGPEGPAEIMRHEWFTRLYWLPPVDSTMAWLNDDVHLASPKLNRAGVSSGSRSPCVPYMV